MQGNRWLAESGSTKTDWVCYAGPQAGMRFHTPGFNPSYLDNDRLRTELTLALDGRPWEPEEVGDFVWYGAGCAGEEPSARLQHVLTGFLPNAAIRVEHDLLAAARATQGQKPGLVAILGTGSHCCAFDGTAIGAEAVSLGYMLGDEGGGADLGRRLLRLYLYGQLPPEEIEFLDDSLRLSREDVLEHLYRRPWPNRWMASLTRQIALRPYLRQTVAFPAFRSFSENHLMPLAVRTGQTTVSAVGSVASHFEAELRTALEPVLSLHTVLASPLEGLILYHQQNS